MAGSEKLPVDIDPSSNHRIVLLDHAAEATWRRTSSSDTCIDCRANDWSEATEWLTRCATSGANRKCFVSWAAGRLGFNPFDIKTVSTPFRETFAARLIGTVPEKDQVAAKLSAEALGWTASGGLSLHQRWTGLAYNCFGRPRSIRGSAQRRRSNDCGRDSDRSPNGRYVM
jgi:hypothetical protein